MPEVSVVIPAYNYAKHTAEAVNSVLQQTYRDYEIIVVDDGSTDNTKEILQPFIEKKQIKYIYQENKGASNARNTGIKNSSGEYIALLDCDDSYLPRKLELSIARLEQNTGVGLVYTPILYMNESGKILRRDKMECCSGMVLNKLILDNFIRNSTVVIRRQYLERVGLFNETLFYTADWDMWLRIATYFLVDYVPIPLSMYRFRENDYLVRNTEKVKSEMLRVVGKIFYDKPSLNGRLKHRILSQIFFWTAKAYLTKLDLSKARTELVQSLHFCPANQKACLLAMLLRLTGPVFPLIYRYKKIWQRFKWN